MGFHTAGAPHWQANAFSQARTIDLGRYAYHTEDVRRQIASQLHRAPALLEFAPAVLTHPASLILQGYALESDDVC
jgi:hypothetical protein